MLMCSCWCNYLSRPCGKKNKIVGIAHITGGSFYDKISRILPDNTHVIINKGSWKVPEIFNTIQKKGNVSDKDIYRTLNMGIGMVIFVKPKFAKEVMKSFRGAKAIGFVQKGKKGVEII